METTIEKNTEQNMDRYDPTLDNKLFPPSDKLEKAKAYFQQHGVPDFDKILKESAEKKTR